MYIYLDKATYTYIEFSLVFDHKQTYNNWCIHVITFDKTYLEKTKVDSKNHSYCNYIKVKPQVFSGSNW